MLHEIDNQSGILDSVTKWHAMARTPAEIPGLIREAVKQLRSGRPRPVAVEIPPDVLAARAPLALVDPAGDPGVPVAPEPQLVARAAQLLRAARRPVIWTGWGVQAADGSEELRELAEALEAPVVMGRSGRGSLSDHHHLALNGLGGRRVLPEADVVLVVGSRFVTQGARAVATAAGARLILVNADENDLGGPRTPDVAIHGDARLTLRALRDELTDLAAPASRRAELDEVRAWSAAQLAPIEPQRSWLGAVRAALPEDGIFVNELTQVGYAARVGFPSYAPRTMISPGYQGTLGYGFPTALGVKVANPDRAVVSITGDGGFGWGLAELATARKYGIGLVTIVFSDGAFGNVRRTQKEDFDGRYIATDLVNPDFVKLAEAFGVAGHRVSSPDELRSTLDKALTGNQPALIEVPVGEMPSVWHLIR
jgi:acetolactate synthase-1/2/3 large subunit